MYIFYTLLLLPSFLFTGEPVQTDEIFTVSFQITNMVYHLKLMGTEIHDTIKMCLYCIENKIMAVGKKFLPLLQKIEIYKIYI